MHDSQDAESIPPDLLGAARQAVAHLESLQRLALAECGLPPDQAAPEQARLVWQPGMRAEDLAAAAFQQAQAALSTVTPIQPGRVYCYRCASAGCEHGAPPEPSAAFAGYANTGAPLWQALPNLLLALEDDRIDRLYGDHPAVLARVVGRKRLIADQFSAYGRNSLTYRILGQVVAGLWAIGGERYALSMQVVETADHALHLQTIADPCLERAITDAGDHTQTPLYRVHDARRQLDRRVREIAGAWQGCLDRGERAGLRERLFASLRQYASSLERHRRQRERRTPHAQQRAQERRPVAKAVEDVHAASAADFYRDRKTQSVVVLGRRGRSHVFSAEGRHITSLALAGDVLERRKARRRYVPLAADERAAFCQAVGAPSR